MWDQEGSGRSLIEERGGRRSLLGDGAGSDVFSFTSGERDDPLAATPPLIGAPFRAMTYPVTLRRVSESAAKSLSTHPVKPFRFSAISLLTLTHAAASQDTSWP